MQVIAKLSAPAKTVTQAILSFAAGVEIAQFAGMGNLFARLVSVFRQLGTALVISVVFSSFVIAASDGQTGSAVRQNKPSAKPQITEQEIAEARRLLDTLGYWVELEATGLDASLRHALIAFQKVESRPKTGVLNPAELEALRSAGRPTPRETGFPHIEVDLARQILFVVEIGDISIKVLPISSGSGELFTEGEVTRRAVTPTGSFKIQRKIEGWRKSPLGLLHYPNYIYGGIAIHGNPQVPATPASHGCIRIPMFASKKFSELTTIGMVVIVYDNSPTP